MFATPYRHASHSPIWEATRRSLNCLDRFRTRNMPMKRQLAQNMIVWSPISAMSKCLQPSSTDHNRKPKPPRLQVVCTSCCTNTVHPLTGTCRRVPRRCQPVTSQPITGSQDKGSGHRDGRYLIHPTFCHGNPCFGTWPTGVRQPVLVLVHHNVSSICQRPDISLSLKSVVHKRVAFDTFVTFAEFSKTRTRHARTP